MARDGGNKGQVLVFLATLAIGLAGCRSWPMTPMASIASSGSSFFLNPPGRPTMRITDEGRDVVEASFGFGNLPGDVGAPGRLVLHGSSVTCVSRDEKTLDLFPGGIVLIGDQFPAGDVAGVSPELIRITDESKDTILVQWKGGERNLAKSPDIDLFWKAGTGWVSSQS